MSIKVKVLTVKVKRVQTDLKHDAKYHVKHIIKFGDFNVGRVGRLLTLPNKMQFFLGQEPEEIFLERIDVDDVNDLTKEILGCWLLILVLSHCKIRLNSQFQNRKAIFL